MFNNLRYKLFALGLAIVFWIFVVSLKSAFVEFSTLIPIQVFNLGEKLAIAEMTDGVILTLQSENPDVLRQLKSDDFDVYVDLQNSGAGKHKIPIFVNSKNPKVSIFRVTPSDANILIEPIKDSIIPLKLTVLGSPAQGFILKDKTSNVQSVKTSGAENSLSKAYEAIANYQFDGTERKSFSQKVKIGIFDNVGKLLTGLTPEPAEVEVVFELLQSEIQKQVGVKIKTIGSPVKGFVRALSVDPAVITISGDPQVISEVSLVETESIDLKDLFGIKEFKADLNLSEGVKVVEGDTVKVKVEIGEE